MTPKVKICGITSIRDALAAVEFGADALGFMFYQASPRVVSNESVTAIVRELPPFLTKVGVFVNASEETIRKAIVDCGLDTLQFHGEEPPEFCRRFGLKAIKAFRVRGAESLVEMAAYQNEAWLLDAFVPGKLGGTGAQFNWDIAKQATKLSQRVILAGGLTPDNIGQAVKEIRPYGVDVSSGVESAPGKKDHAKVRDFIAAAKAGATGSER